jgi:hypothetical protein
MRRAFVVLAGLLLTLAVARPAAADPSNDATLTVSPNPTSAYYAGTETFAGCGYPTGVWVDAVVTPPGAAFGVVVGAGPVDAAGCIDIVTAGWVAGAGEYLATAAHQVQTGRTVRWRVLAETPVTVG